jgi:NACalpha-BTF3-like transcription factor
MAGPNVNRDKTMKSKNKQRRPRIRKIQGKKEFLFEKGPGRERLGSKMRSGPMLPGNHFKTATYNGQRRAQVNHVKSTIRERAPREKKGVPWYKEAADIGGSIASVAKSVLPMLTGFGDYEVESNSILANETEGKLGNEVPIIKNTKNSNIVSHREYIGDVLSSTSSFSSQVFNLNPGMDETYPWLAPLANNYTQWVPRGMVFELVSEASNTTATVGMGYMAMATQYNSQEAAFEDKKSMLNHEFATSGKPSKSQVHPIECKKSELVLGNLYVRAGTPPSSSDIRFYDLGKLTVATGGQATGGIVIAELWCTYEIEFLVPKMSAISGVSIGYDNYYMVGCAGPTPFGNGTQIKLANSNLGTVMTPGVTSKIAFKNGTRGRYIFEYVISGTTQIIVKPTWAAVNCVGVAAQFAGFSPFETSAAATSTTYVYLTVIDVLLDGAYLTVTDTGTLPTVATAGLVITQIPRALAMSDMFSHRLSPKDTDGVLNKYLKDKIDFKKIQSELQEKTSLKIICDSDESSEESDVDLKTQFSQWSKFMEMNKKVVNRDVCSLVCTTPCPLKVKLDAQGNAWAATHDCHESEDESSSLDTEEELDLYIKLKEKFHSRSKRSSLELEIQIPLSDDQMNVVMNQTNCLKATAYQALQDTKGDVTAAIAKIGIPTLWDPVVGAHLQSPTFMNKEVVDNLKSKRK